MKRRLILLPLLLGCCFLGCCFLGCGFDQEAQYFGTTERRGRDLTTLYVNNVAEPEYLDPGLVSDTGSAALVEDLFEGLVGRHPRDLHPIQGVATHWDQTEDNTVFRFHLRPDARWSDGQPVTAHDFVYAWSRVLTAKTGARAAATLYVLKNGALFHQGKLMVLQRDERFRAKRDGDGGELLKAGTALEVVESKDGWARVKRFDELPTFAPKVEARDEKDKDEKKEKPKKEPEGFVPGSSLAPDASVLGVRAKGHHELEVELENPTPYFVELCGHTTFFPVRKDVVERFEKLGQTELWFRPENIVTNGPYTLDEWRFRYEIRFKRNPHYYDHDRLKLHRIVWMEVDANATMNLYYAGELDFAGTNWSAPESFMDMLERYKDFSRAPYLSTYWYEFNTKKKPVDDVLVRRALNLAVDKQLLVDKIGRADQVPATHFVPDPAGSGYSEQAEADRRAGKDPFSGPGHDFDPQRARTMLGEAGYPVEKKGDRYQAKGFPGVEILYNTGYEGHRSMAIAIQGMWQEHLGIRVQLRSEEWKVMLKNMRDGHFQVARLGWGADYNHPHTWLETFLSYSGNNWTHWKDPEYDKLVETAAATADPVESIKLYRQAEARAVDGMPRLPLYVYTKSTLVKPYVRGFWDNAQNQHHVRWMWIDTDWQKGGENTPAYPPPEFPKPGRIAAP
ncbi:MAG TPA: peptide ABC transporter substrate-binding protein [Polyangiaceae bacterium]|nr:peptide ABC transporter substrate-binding protein [Polyangiaceae bacterium]